MKAFLTFSFTLLLNPLLFSQDITVGASYFGSPVNEKEICNWVSYTSRPEVNRAVENIVKRSGLKQNFYVMECPNTNNCFAANKNGERLIVYDAQFFAGLNAITRSHWASLSVLAHEIGHHLQGHTIKNIGSDHQRELEADEFSGFVMYQMGASLHEAQLAIRSISPEYTTYTHPPRSQRLKAIKTGYYNARELYPGLKVESEGLSFPDLPKSKTGCIEGNCTDGFGIAVNTKTFYKYIGSWKMGKRSGKGMEYDANGNLKYCGDFKYSKYHGLGTLYFENGSRFEGEFLNGEANTKNGHYFDKNGRIKQSAGQLQTQTIAKEKELIILFPPKE